MPRSNPLILVLLTLTAACPAQDLATIEETYESGARKARYKVDAEKRRVGPYVEYHESGSVKIKATYREGKLHGRYEELFESGRKRRERRYELGELQRMKTLLETGEVVHQLERKGDRLSLVPEPGRAAKRVRIHPRGRSVIEKKLREIDPNAGRMTKVEFDQRPDLKSPFAPGVASEACIQDALRRVNAYRYLCGLPHDVSAAERLNRLAACAALVNCLNGRLSHTPRRPSGIDGNVFVDGETGASQCNLHSGQNNLRGAVDGFMDDSDYSNILVVGHRRWVLSPRMARTGFGAANGFVAMHAHDRSRRDPGLHMIRYPSPGYFPAEYLAGPHVAWSVCFDDDRFELSRKTEVAAWLLDDDFDLGEKLELEFTGCDRAVLAGMRALVFLPRWPARTFKPGLKVLVRISGYTERKKPRSLAYVVHLF